MECYDLDGTLISSYMENADKNYHTWQILPNRIEELAGKEFAIVSNQAGVAFGLISVEEVIEKFLPVARLFGYGGIELCSRTAHDGF